MKKKKQRSKKKINSQKKLMKKIRASGRKVAVTPKGQEKMSEVIENFAQPLLADCRSDDDRKKSIRFAILIWNLTILPEDEQDKTTQDLVKTLSAPGNIDEINEAKQYINSFINRKKEMFPHIQRAVLDYQFSGAGSNLRLDIVSADKNV